jgi:hypothetical protein
MCDMVTVGGKDSGLEPVDRISTLMFSVLDLLTDGQTDKSIPVPPHNFVAGV